MEKAFTCNLCCGEFNSRYTSNAHIERQHERSRESEMKKTKCTVCGYEFSTAEILRNHMREHTGERLFKCKANNCVMAFKLEKKLKNHINSEHIHKRSFECDFPGCLYAAKTSASLFQHKKVHSNERPFACSNGGCSFRVKWKSQLTRHLKRVHGEARTFDCSKCDYKTAGSTNFKLHMLLHSRRKDFKCTHPQCEKSFKSSYLLKRHFSRRHAERNIPCNHPTCAKKFANATALREHKRNVHAKRDHTCPNFNSSFSTNTATASTDEIIAHEGSNEKIACSMDQVELADSFGFACMLCDFVGYSYGAALDHAKCHRQPLVLSPKLTETPTMCLD